MGELAYRIDLSYRGCGFEGWQTQPNARGIQDHMEKALGIFLGHPVKVIGSSRTDSGVHAEHQVALFKTGLKVDPERMLKSLNALTPKDIGIQAIIPAPSSFHPIHCAKAKAYRYRIWHHKAPNPFLAEVSWHIKGELDPAKMRAELATLVGKHDFTSFCATDSCARSKVRTIMEIAIDERGPLIDLWIIGDGFLKQMIRTIAGTLIEFGLAKRPPGSLPEILAAKDRTKAGITAPGRGLSLVRVFYGDIPTSATLITEARNGYCMAFYTGMT